MGLLVFGNQAAINLSVLLPRDPPPTKPTIYRITSTATLTSPSTLTVGRQQLLVGHDHMISQPPSPYMASSSSRHLPQLTSQRSNYSFATLPAGGKGGDVGPDENEDARPYLHSQTTTRAPSSTVDDHRSSREQGGGRVSRRSSRRGTTASDSFPMPIDPPQFDFDGLQQAQGRGQRDVAGRSGTNLQSTLGWKSASRRDVRDTDSGELLTHETTRVDAKLIVGVDIRHGVDGNQSRNPSSALICSLDRTLAMTTF